MKFVFLGEPLDIVHDGFVEFFGIAKLLIAEVLEGRMVRSPPARVVGIGVNDSNEVSLERRAFEIDLGDELGAREDVFDAFCGGG